MVIASLGLVATRSLLLAPRPPCSSMLASLLVHVGGTPGRGYGIGIRHQSVALGATESLLRGIRALECTMGNTWIVDLRHYLTPTGAMADMPPRARILAEYFASI